MAESTSLNEYIKNDFEKKKEKYPNLKDFSYDEKSDTLTYNNLSFSPAAYALSRIDSSFFQLVPEDIFSYLKNGLYYQSSNEISKIRNMITAELIITEEEQAQLKYFVRQYFKRLAIYTNNNFLFANKMEESESLKNFASDLLERQKIVNGVRTGIYRNIAASVILQEYDSISNELKRKQPTPENTNEQTNENNQDFNRGMSLTRQKPGYNFQSQEEIDRQTEKEQHLGMAGFTSLILIIGTAITFGMYLALQLM